jgi:ribosome-binding ATPase YchF (GTP1/OBG family)
MGLMKTADALVVVLRNFPSETLDGIYGPPAPMKDLETIDTELLLADQIVAERRLERIQADLQRGKKTPVSQAEEKVMIRIVEALNTASPSDPSSSPRTSSTDAGLQVPDRDPVL